MPGVARDEDVPTAVEELATDRVELLRASGELMEQHESPLRAISVGVQPGVALRVDVGAVEIFQRCGDTDAFVVMQGLVRWILT
jgi:hypothetical protein